jgi:DNA-binding PadR family transcriptional regulator
MAMLALLDCGPSHGFDLKRRYDGLLGGDRALKYGQVYSTLARLERDGLAAGVGLQPGSGADRRVYAITPGGVAELDSWLATASTPPLDRDGFFARVVLALASGRAADAVLDAHRRVFLDRMRALTAARADADGIGRLGADYEIAHLEADLRWIELAASRLESPHGVLPLGSSHAAKLGRTRSESSAARPGPAPAQRLPGALLEEDPTHPAMFRSPGEAAADGAPR